MLINTVAILSPGDMGHAVGQLLKEHELKVITCLTGRSERTKGLAHIAGIEDMADFDEMVSTSDLIMSITVSEIALSLCQEVAAAIQRTGSNVLFAECNALSPETTKAMEPVITHVGGRFIDVSIIGSPPRNGRSPRFYTSGANANEFEKMRDFGLDIRNIGPNIGQASGIKMCYAAMTKGTAALHAQLLLAAATLGLYDPLMEEFTSGHKAVIERMEGWIPGVPAKSRRWVSEMQEIEATFKELGMTPHIFEGVADMYRLIGSTDIADETPETRDKGRSLKETIEIISSNLS